MTRRQLPWQGDASVAAMRSRPRLGLLLVTMLCFASMPFLALAAGQPKPPRNPCIGDSGDCGTVPAPAGEASNGIRATTSSP